jgi:hypothetical protein
LAPASSFEGSYPMKVCCPCLKYTALIHLGV